MKHESVLLNKFMKHFNALTRIVETPVAETLRDVFSLVLDGWYINDTHYDATFATYTLTMQKASKMFYSDFHHLVRTSLSMQKTITWKYSTKV